MCSFARLPIRAVPNRAIPFVCPCLLRAPCLWQKLHSTQKKHLCLVCRACVFASLCVRFRTLFLSRVSFLVCFMLWNRCAHSDQCDQCVVLMFAFRICSLARALTHTQFCRCCLASFFVDHLWHFSNHWSLFHPLYASLYWFLWTFCFVLFRKVRESETLFAVSNL